MKIVKAKELLNLDSTETRLIQIMTSSFEKLELKKEGLFLIGGFVRDKVFNQEIRDYDFICSKFNFFKLTRHLEANADKLGLSKFTIHRLSAKTCKGDYLFKCVFLNKEIEIKMYSCKLIEDTAKRDFTINSVYFDIFSHNLLDYCNGIRDIHNKLLITVNPFDKTFDDSFERFIRLARFGVKGLTIDYDLIDKTKSYFKTQQYKKVKVNWQSVALQMDRAFESESTAQIFDNLKRLCIINCLHNEFKHFATADLIYNETVILLHKLDTVLYHPLFKRFITNTLGESFEYVKTCGELKKAAVAYVFLRRDLFGDFTNINDLGLKIQVRHTYEPCLQKLLKSFNFGKMDDYLCFFDKDSKYPFLGLILIVKGYSVKDLKASAQIKVITESKYFARFWPQKHSEVDFDKSLYRGNTAFTDEAELRMLLKDLVLSDN